jgi:8-oxo-dGTP diphosphatase
MINSNSKNLVKQLVCNRPHIGVGVIIIKDNKVLIGTRIGSHGSNTGHFPGGKLDYDEEVFDCAKRETLEEAGIKIKNLRIGPYTNDYFKSENLHYVTLFVIADYASGKVRVMEPHKCLEWQWREWNNLSQPLFLPIANLLKQGFNPFKK